MATRIEHGNVVEETTLVISAMVMKHIDADTPGQEPQFERIHASRKHIDYFAAMISAIAHLMTITPKYKK